MNDLYRIDAFVDDVRSDSMIEHRLQMRLYTKGHQHTLAPFADQQQTLQHIRQVNATHSGHRTHIRICLFAFRPNGLRSAGVVHNRL